MCEDGIAFTDVLGIKVYVETIKNMAEGIGSLLAKICNPAAEEISFLFNL